MIIGLIGAGHFGSAVAQCLLATNTVEPQNFIVLESAQSRAAELQKKHPIQVLFEPGSQLQKCNFVILAVKPQDFQVASKQVQPFLDSNAVILSVMAGVSIAKIQSLLTNQNKFVRCMPNLPCKIGKGVVPYVVQGTLGQEELSSVSLLLSALGESMTLESEELLNAATAVSGSGPGYVFYVVKAWVDAAIKLGFDESQARKLVFATLAGSLELLRLPQSDLSQLKSSVCSKGGTTEAAFSVFDQADLSRLWDNALNAACERSRALNRG